MRELARVFFRSLELDWIIYEHLAQRHEWQPSQEKIVWVNRKTKNVKMTH